MNILIKHKRSSLERLRSGFPHAEIIDVTSQGTIPYLKFSPFFAHGNIPIPFFPGSTSQSVEGIWQGLKVFETAGIDPAKFSISNMKNLKRSVRSLGQVKGHQAGLASQQLLAYKEARQLIYLPSYKWVLDNCLQPEIATLKQFAAEKTLILLDYTTNEDWQELSKPLSHAGLLKKYLQNQWP